MSIDAFKLGPVLGSGATGVVRLGTHERTGLQVAMKIIKKKGLEHEQSQKIRREVAILKVIDHPNVLQLYNVIETKSKLYLVLEHVEGGELFDYIINQGRLPRQEVLRLLAQIVQGLQHCHDHGICHRDLKPENLLLDERRQIKIADFGLAYMMKPGQMLDTNCGSPHYICPEIVEGKEYDGKKADVWSLGVVAYALMTGFLPFDHDNTPQLLEIVKQGKYVMPPTVDKDIANLISRMLTVDPEKRIAMKEIQFHECFAHTHVFDSSFVSPLQETWRALKQESLEALSGDSELDIEIMEDLTCLGLGRQEELKIKLVQAVTGTFEENMEKIFYLILRQRKDAIEALDGSPVPIISIEDASAASGASGASGAGGAPGAPGDAPKPASRSPRAFAPRPKAATPSPKDKLLGRARQRRRSGENPHRGSLLTLRRKRPDGLAVKPPVPGAPSGGDVPSPRAASPPPLFADPPSPRTRERRGVLVLPGPGVPAAAAAAGAAAGAAAAAAAGAPPAPSSPRGASPTPSAKPVQVGDDQSLHHLSPFSLPGVEGAAAIYRTHHRRRSSDPLADIPKEALFEDYEPPAGKKVLKLKFATLDVAKELKRAPLLPVSQPASPSSAAIARSMSGPQAGSLLDLKQRKLLKAGGGGEGEGEGEEEEKGVDVRSWFNEQFYGSRKYAYSDAGLVRSHSGRGGGWDQIKGRSRVHTVPYPSAISAHNKGAALIYLETCLTMVLLTPTAKNHFKAFLIEKYSDDHLLFWLDPPGEAFVGVGEEELLRKTQTIFEQYQQPPIIGAKDKNQKVVQYQLNGRLLEMIPLSLHFISARKSLPVAKDQPLTPSQDAFRQLMTMTCFPEFLESKHGASMVAEMKGKEGELLKGLVKSCGRAITSLRRLGMTRKKWFRNFVSAAENLPLAVSLADMREADQPVAYVNEEFERVTGFSREHVIGRNCRFLQGKDTSISQLAILRNAFEEKLPRRIYVCIENYKRQQMGRLAQFYNFLAITPIFDQRRELRYAVGIQCDVGDSIKRGKLGVDLLYIDAVLKLLPDFCG